jgi:regulator of protease activity HflC (stomatin/prohibitin superfamily)
VRRLEYGVIHEVAIVPTQHDGQKFGVGTEAEPPVRAEGDPPPSADRLWDMPHHSEVTYLIASADNGQQGFQVVDIDIRLIYRIGLSDAASLNTAYQVEAPEALVRAAASRLLARYFAAHTLSGVFHDNRDTIAGDIRSALQRQLDELSSGIEMLQVVIEAIHPPTGAAYAYHAVQAAEINARTAIAKEQGDAIRAAKLAIQESTSAVDGARAASAETIEAARHDAELFHADTLAQRASGHVFRFERWLDRLSHALSDAQIVLLDYRLTGIDAPTIDLRAFAPPTAKPREQDQGRPK